MFNYHQPNLENMQQYLSQESERVSSGGPNWWSIPSGMSSVRILPPWDPSGRVALPVYMHPIEYKGEGMSYAKYNWTCVNRTFNKTCPICEGLSNLSESGVDISNWEANRRQFYFNALVMHDPTYNAQKNSGTAPGTHVLLRAPKTFYDWIISQITNPMIGDITNIETGIDVYITKEGTGLGTTYSMTLSPNGRTPIPKEYLEKITDLYDLDEIFSVGFEKKQIDELVEHLKKSAGVMPRGVQNTMSQMGGYQQNTIPYGAPPNSYQVTPSPFTVGTAGDPTPPAPNITGPANPYVSITAPNPSTSESSNLPKCFGQYDAGNVNCVVCPKELDCSKQTSEKPF